MVWSVPVKLKVTGHTEEEEAGACGVCVACKRVVAAASTIVARTHDNRRDACALLILLVLFVFCFV